MTGSAAYNLGAMQHDAQRRVYEMQKRAQIAVSGNAISAPDLKWEEFTRSPSQYKSAPDYIPAGKRICELHKPPEHQIIGTPVLSPLLRDIIDDPERLLILAVVLLLSSQDCDPLLLPALLYII